MRLLTWDAGLGRPVVRPPKTIATGSARPALYKKLVAATEWIGADVHCALTGEGGRGASPRCSAPISEIVTHGLHNCPPTSLHIGVRALDNLRFDFSASERARRSEAVESVCQPVTFSVIANPDREDFPSVAHGLDVLFDCVLIQTFLVLEAQVY